MIRCAFLEMKRLPSSVTPRRTSASISSISEPGSTTTPQPITQRHPGCRMPEGIVCRTYFSRPTTTVWPALLPPAKRATTFTCGASMSTTLPLPSSPHCVPTTTMLGMAFTSEDTLWMFENLADRQHAFRSVRQVHCHDLSRRGARLAAGGDGGAEARHVRLEVGPGVVVETADLAQVEQHALGEPVDLEQPVHLGQVGQRPRRPIVAREGRRTLQHHFAPEERRQGQERGAHVRRRR